MVEDSVIGADACMRRLDHVHVGSFKAFAFTEFSKIFRAVLYVQEHPGLSPIRTTFQLFFPVGIIH